MAIATMASTTAVMLPVVSPVSVTCLMAAIKSDNPPHVLGSRSLPLTMFIV